MNKKQVRDIFTITINEVFEWGLVRAVDKAMKKRRNGYSISEEEDFARYRDEILKALKKELKEKFNLILQEVDKK